MASVNAKGLILSDFYIINYNLSDIRLISKIDKFQCLVNEQEQLISIQWTVDDKSRLYIEKYVLYYSDLTEKNNDLVRMLTIPINLQSNNDLIKYEFNISSFKLNSHPSHILHLNLAPIDQNQNQLLMISSATYCIFTREFGKNDKYFS